jgi:hypothetical protein
MATPFRKDPNAEPAKPAAFNEPRSLTAAATRINLTDQIEAGQFKIRSSSGTRQWQTEAWEYFDAIGEVKYAFGLVANVVSRIRLYPAVLEDPSDAPVEIRNSTTIDPDLADAATRALARLDSAYGGQAGLLRDAALNLSVAGECYLVQIPEQIGSGIPESWDIRSVDELQVDKGTYSIAPRRDLVGKKAGTPGVKVLPPQAFLGRMWRAHPRFSEDPDSSMKGVLDLCAELLLLNRSFRGSERSRLNAGILYIPDGLSNAANPDPDLYSDEEGDVDVPTPEEMADDFEESLVDAMATPIEDEASASAVVPLLVRGPVELGKEIRHIKLERTWEEAMNVRSDRVLERILQGLDVPKDVITGLANVKYSNAIQIDEALYKSHIEPMLLLIADAFTVVFLRPYLISEGWSEADVKRLVVWYDPSAVATRNDRAADADSGYEKMAISAETWRRQHGFSDADAPTQNELLLRMLTEKASFTPELTESLLKIIAPEIMDAARAASQASNVAPIPTDVQQALSGAPVDPAAAVDPTAPVDPAAPATPATDGPPVEPGADAPPFPLAEPE